MKYFVLIPLIFSAIYSRAQVSVFDCGTYTNHPTQTELDAGTNFYGACFTFGENGPIHSDGSDNKTIWASKKITLKKGTHFGGFNNSGKMHLLLSNPSAIDVAVMNYNDLNAVLRYKKLEFGVPISVGLNDSIFNFIRKLGAQEARLNPFVEWDIDVEATFYNPNSGWYESVDGFFTRDYIEVGDTGVVLEGNVEIIDDWLDVDSIPGNLIGNQYPFRIRYAPPKNGEWICQVIIKIKGDLAYRSQNFTFNVVESGDPGYVHIHENNRNLKRGNRMIFPVGQNFPSPGDDGCGGHYMDLVNDPKGPNTEKCANLQAWNDYLDDVKAYFNFGNQYTDPDKPKFIRFIANPATSLIEFEEKGNYFKRLHYAYEMDKLVDILEEHDGLMIFDLMLQSPFMYRSFYWQWCWEHLNTDGSYLDWAGAGSKYPHYCYNDTPGPSGTEVHDKRPDEMLTDPIDLAYHKQRTRYYIARYGYSTKIYEWEMLSEPFHLDEDSYNPDKPFININNPNYNHARHAVANYHRVISDYIKDSLKHWQQLVGIDMGYGSSTIDYQSIRLKNIDIVGFNPYYGSPEAVYNIETYVNDIEVNRVFASSDPIMVTGLTPLPVIISEGGISNYDYDGCSNFALHPVDAMSLGFTGIAGFHFWSGFQRKEDGSYYTDLWKDIFRAQAHMNGEDVINTLSQGGGDWKQGKEKGKPKDNYDVEAVEMQYYISNNKKLIVGYIGNRTYNVATKGYGPVCTNAYYDDLNKIKDLKPIDQLHSIKWDDIKSGNRLKVDENLGWRKEYNTHFYSFKVGDWIINNKRKTKIGGKLRIEYPELTTSGNNPNPVIWFVSYKEDGKSGIKLNEDPDIDEDLDYLSKLLTTENKNLLNIKIYPNPFQDYFWIDNPKEDIIYIQDLTGKVLKQQSVAEGKIRINTSGLTKGIYFIQFINQAKSFKLIKL